MVALPPFGADYRIDVLATGALVLIEIVPQQRGKKRGKMILKTIIEGQVAAGANGSRLWRVVDRWLEKAPIKRG